MWFSKKSVWQGATMHMMKLKYVFSICAMVAVLSFATTAQAQACTSTTPCSLSAGAQFCAGLQGFFAGSTNDPLNLNDRIFVVTALGVTQTGITVPFLNNGTVWVAPCVNNTSGQE